MNMSTKEVGQGPLEGFGQVRSMAAGVLMASLALCAPLAGAQPAPPDAGRILQENRNTELQPPRPVEGFQPQGQRLTETPEGGPEVQVTELRISGNSVYSESELLEVVGDLRGRPFDLAELRAVANELSTFYRNNGYLFARAVLPPQDLIDGVLLIEVVEGRYGTVLATGKDSISAGAQPFLSALKPGAVISSRPLERTMLLLDDQPGVSVAPAMRPGTLAGTGDIEVVMQPLQRVEIDMGGDNHGGEYSGEYRGHLGLRMNSLARFGDQVSVRGSYSSEGLLFGEAGYSLPLGGSGLRGNLSYARTTYELAAPFDDLSGTADVAAVGLSYPLIRTSMGNLTASAAFNHKDLENEVQGERFESKSSRSWPVGLQFDRRDALGGGGVTYGAVTVTPGDLESDDDAAVQGSFVKANLQLVRSQNIGRSLSLFTRLSGQWSDSALDSSESFILGGATAVRAYPQGEAAGAKGMLAQLELRYRTRYVDPYLFYDTGRIDEDAQNDSRTLAGGGVGLRHSNDRFRLDLAAAWRTKGGDASTADNQRDPQLWLSSSFFF